MTATAETRTFRTFRTAKGLEVTSHLTDAEAARLTTLIPPTHRSYEFARDLRYKMGGRYGLSEGQLAWLHKLALENDPDREAPAPPEKAGNFARITFFLQPAVETLKSYARVAFATDAGYNVEIRSAWKQGKHQGAFWVSNGRERTTNVLFGKLDGNGDWWPKPDCPPGVTKLLADFSADPEAYVIRYGVRTGTCCFCTNPLTDESSVKLGYGPICARHYRLPHGRKGIARYESLLRELAGELDYRPAEVIPDDFYAM